MNRGGSFNNPAVNARSANRNRNAPTIANNDLGLRPAKTSAGPNFGAADASSGPRCLVSDAQATLPCFAPARPKNGASIGGR